jgi:Acetoacetate decarboxylase (ADC)
MEHTPEIKIAPAPWNLTGDAYIMVYKFSKDFVEEYGFLADYQQDRFLGYVGTVMLVDYKTSGVGPYRELLFIPGMFTFDWKKMFSISKIYVSSRDSVYNGIENWGIPKEYADFDWQTNADGTEDISVNIDGKEFFKTTIKKGFVSFPLTTSILPLNVVQKLRKDLIITNPTAKGKATLSKIKSMKVDKNFFPDLSKASPLITMKVKDFEMTFNVPLVKKDYFGD